jgi:hypothetical protein
MDRKDKELLKPEGISLTEIENMSLDDIDALSPEEIEIALKRAELREKAMRLAQLTKEFKKTREEEAKIKKSQEDAISQSKVDAAQKAWVKKNCTHRKGGKGAGVVLKGQGTDVSDYAVVHHLLPSGTEMILCLRCGTEEYGYNPLTGQPETPGYQEFRRFPTNNTMSTSSLFVPVQRPQPQAK